MPCKILVLKGINKQQQHRRAVCQVNLLHLSRHLKYPKLIEFMYHFRDKLKCIHFIDQKSKEHSVQVTFKGQLYLNI